MSQGCNHESLHWSSPYNNVISTVALHYIRLSLSFGLNYQPLHLQSKVVIFEPSQHNLAFCNVFISLHFITCLTVHHFLRCL